MTPKEKAEELFNKYFSEIRMPSDCEGCMQCVDRCGNMVAIAKKYALIAVDEVLNVWENQQPRRFEEWLGIFQYWQEVKQEIEKL
jgi:hypothetical protein